MIGRILMYVILGYVLFYMLNHNQTTILFFIGCYLVYKFLTRKRSPKNATQSLEKQIVLLRSSIEQMTTMFASPMKKSDESALRSPLADFGTSSKVSPKIYGNVNFSRSSGSSRSIEYFEKIQNISNRF